MSTLAEIEAAADALPPEQKEELIRFLASRLEASAGPSAKASLVPGPHGTLLLKAPPNAPRMNTEKVKQLLEDFP